MNQYDDFRVPTPSEVAREMNFVKMEPRDTERILRQGEIKRAERLRQWKEWFVVGVVIAGILLVMKFCGFGGTQ